MAYVAMTWEVVGAIALLVGFKPRLAALALIPVLLGAIFTVHGAAGFWFTNANGGWEYPAFWIVGLISLALIGDGPYHLKSSFKS
jgi:putative oxidoreductase